MKKILLRDVVNAVSGKFYGDTNNELNKFIFKVTTDSRKENNDGLFVALKGPKFDGHDFVEQAYNNGAVCILSEKILDINKDYIKVESTRKALLDLAKYYRDLFNIKVVAITGSNGKTTTKDMTAAVLAKKYKVTKTIGNYNNYVGLPISVFEINDETEIAVLEMGMNNPGEIKGLSYVTRPDVCVMINIGLSHIGNFLNQEEIFKSKYEMFYYAKENCLAVLNGDDKFLKKVDRKNKVCFGLDESNNDVFAYDIKDDCFKVNVLSCEIKLNFPGKFMIKNMLAAIVVGKYFNIEDEEIKSALENFETPRMKFINLNKNIVLIDDSYNCSPNSLRESIKVLCELKLPQKKVCVLGDMLELGDRSEELHKKIGKYLFENKKEIDSVVCIGKQMKNVYDELKDFNKKMYFDNKKEFIDNINNFDWQNSCILIKASHAMAFDELVNKFCDVYKII